MPQPLRICILGGGLGGLSSAYFLQKLLPTCQIFLYESSERYGGWLKSERRNSVNFEWGPNSIRGGNVGSLTWSVIQDIGLHDEVLEASDAGGKRYIIRNGSLVQVGVKDLLLRHPRVLLEPFQQKGVLDEPLLNFFNRRLGPEVTAEYIDAFINGIYAGGLERLSAESTAPFHKLKDLEQRYGSIAWGIFRQWLASKPPGEPYDGPKRPYTFTGGMDTFTTRLQQYISDPKRLNPVQCKLRSKMDPSSLKLQPDRIEWTHQCLPQTFDGIISTIPGVSLGKLCADAELDVLLTQQRSSASVWTVNISFPHTEATKSLQGFGHLVPGKENDRALGVIWNSSLWNSEVAHFTLMFGGKRAQEVQRMSRPHLLSKARQTLQKHLNIEIPDDSVEMELNHAADCIRHYEVGHKARVEKIRALVGPRAVVAGATFDGVSIHDCIKSAHTQVSHLLRRPPFKDLL